MLATARELVEAGEFDEASVGEIAEAAGVSRPTFYSYFASKQELLARLVVLALEDIAAGLITGLDTSAGSPANRLRTAISRGADAWWESRVVMRAALDLAAFDSGVYDRMSATLQPVNALCVDLLMQFGTVPEAKTRASATRLVETLAMMNERALGHALRTARSRSGLRQTERQLLLVWLRALGLDDIDHTAGEPPT